jgi:hypothetical protein
MLKINVNEEKQLTFEVQISGMQSSQIKSYFKVVIAEIEYGFPASIGQETITVKLPPLNQIVGTKIKEGDEAEVRLEVVADGHYLTPWKDYAKLSNPLIVEATIKDDSFVSNSPLKTKLLVSEDGSKQKMIVTKGDDDSPLKEESNEFSDDVVNKLADKLSNLLKTEQADMPVSPGDTPEDEEEEETVEEKCKVEKEKVKEGQQNKTQVLENLLDKTIDAFELNENKKPKSKKQTLEEFKKNLCKEDILKYIERKGTKNPKVQEVIFEQASLAAEKQEPVYILKKVVDIMKKG